MFSEATQKYVQDTQMECATHGMNVQGVSIRLRYTNFSRLRMDYKDRIAQCEGDCLPKDNGSLGKR